jgi:hypothetical protein
MYNVYVPVILFYRQLVKCTLIFGSYMFEYFKLTGCACNFACGHVPAECAAD